MHQISLIVPAFNEAAIIARTIAELDQYMVEQMAEWAYEIVVVDDGSTDGMAEVLEGLNNPRLVVARHSRNMGRGAGIRTGFASASGQYLVCLDADLSYAPFHIERLVTPLHDGTADITLASAYHPEGTVRNVPAFRAFMSRQGNKILSSGVYGKFHTLTCMVRGYRREVTNHLELISTNKDLHIEILQKAALFGYRVIEVPAVLEWRSKDRASRIGQGWLVSFPLFAMSGTIISHLVYNYVLRPGRTLMVPIVGLAVVAVLALLTLLVTWVFRVATSDDANLLFRLYESARTTLLQGALTFTVLLSSLAALLIFVSFYFASQQSKKQFEETYVLMSRINERLKRLEGQSKD